MKDELIEILNIFQEAYIQRDVEKIDDFMNALFDKSETITLIGTSCGEWCMGYAEAKELFLGDWQYWGDLRIKADEARITLLENTALIYVPGTIKYSFYSKKETYTRYLGYIKEYFDESSFNGKKPDKVKLTAINWTLSHLLNQWDGKERSYLWDLRISFVLTKKETGWIIRQMQFSLPVVGYLPDCRIDSFSNDLDSFKLETQKMKEYSINNTVSYKDEVLRLLRDFSKEYLNTYNETAKTADKYFAVNNPLIINTDKAVYTNQEEVKILIDRHRADYDELLLDYDNCLINSNEAVVWVATHGTMKKVIPEDKAFENTMDIIKHISDSDLDDKDKLFKIRRRITDTFKENARGEEYIWPFRFEALLVKEKNNWVFKYLQFSLPFNYILEGKTDAASVLEGGL